MPGFLFTLFAIAVPIGCGLVTAATTAFEFNLARACFVVGAATLLLALVSWGRAYLSRPLASVGLLWAAGLAAVSVSGASGFGGWLWVDYKQSPTVSVADYTISVKCSMASRDVLRSELNGFSLVEIINPDSTRDAGVYAIAQMQQSAGSIVENTINWLPQFINRCSATNLSASPIYSMRIPIDFTWKAQASLSGGTKPGEVVVQATRNITVSNFGLGLKQEQIFYVVNLSEYYVDGFISSSVDIIKSGDRSTSQVKTAEGGIPDAEFDRYIFLQPRPRDLPN